MVAIPLIEPGEGVGDEEGDGISTIVVFVGCEAQIFSHMLSMLNSF